MSLSVEQMHHEMSLLLFRVEPYRICVPSVDVEAIITVPTFRSIPHAPYAVRGVFSYRGQIASIISLRRKFGLHDDADANSGQLVLTRVSCGLTGFWVDEVLDIVASTGDDVIVLPVLSRLTAFDHFIIPDDRIAQYTTFEQIYQAPDASPHQRSPEHSLLNQEVEAGQEEKADDRPSAGTAEGIPLDATECAGEEADSADCRAADEIVRQPDAKRKGTQIQTDRKFDSTADVVDLRSLRTKHRDVSSTFRLKSRCAPASIKSVKKSRLPSDRRQTAVAAANLLDRISRSRIDHQSAADSHVQPEIAGRTTRRRHFPLFTAGVLLLAGLILLTYWLWPQEISFVPVSRGLETEQVVASADPIPAASSKEAFRQPWPEVEGRQDTARPAPIRDNSAVAENVTGSGTSTGDTLGDSAEKLRSEVEVEQNTARSTPTWNDNAATEEMTGSVTSTGEIFGDSAQELRSKNVGEQNAVRATPTQDGSDDTQKDTGFTTWAGETPGDSARELPAEIEEEQYASHSIPTDDNSPVAEKASDSVTVASEKAGEKIGITDATEPETDPASESHVAQTASMKASSAAESENRLLKIETDDFMLTIERGKSSNPQQPPQKASPPTERTGDTEPAPAGAAQVFVTEHTHIVVKGDTLWDIAAKYLGNPFRYPELAELSRIENPHLIYPGDLIRIIKKKVSGESNQ